jgi:proteic killer suppression protein
MLSEKQMIRSYRDKRTRLFAEGQRIPHFHAFRYQAERRLRVLEAATSLQDLAYLSSNHLEALRGDRRGQHSIRINEKWRICFEWPKNADGPENVEIVDYH